VRSFCTAYFVEKSIHFFQSFHVCGFSHMFLFFRSHGYLPGPTTIWKRVRSASATKAPSFSNQPGTGSATKAEIQQPRFSNQGSAAKYAKIQQPRFSNQSTIFSNQGSATKARGSATKVRQPRLSNQGRGTSTTRPNNLRGWL
jgi:hypothetical protein